MSNVPHIDLRDYRHGDEGTRAKFIKTLGDGLVDCGFLTVGGHELDPKVIDTAYDRFKKFFSLDDGAKRQYDKAAGGQRGYTPFGKEQAKDADVPDLKEFWHTGQELAADHPYRSQYGEQYPDNLWPTEFPEMKDALLGLYRGMERCASTILEALAHYFELPPQTFRDMIVDGNSILRTIHYPPLSANTPAGAVRAAAHEDINLITLLIESHGGGLEILTQQGDWLQVDALAGDIIVDSGDMLTRCTNGVIPATTHRVVNPAGDQNHSRYSMPFFAHPYPSCDLTVMERFIEDDRPAQWPPITAHQFLEQRLREIGLK